MTVPPSLLNSLTELQRPSGMRMNSSVITGLTSSLSRARYQLIRTIGNPRGAGFITVPTNGTESLLQNLVARRIVWTAMDGNPFLNTLNHELKGSDSFPVLVAVLGAGIGLVPVVGTGAGLLFAATTTGLDLAKTSHSVIARPGDQIWQIEEIGKSGNRAVHVGSYFVVDPYRQQTPTRGWLIHEERTELTL
jgi:hypothetical protein